MTTTSITFTVEEDKLPQYTDSHLAALWHIGQANPAPFGDRAACAFAEQVGREIISRWLGSVPPELWIHQGRHVAPNRVAATTLSSLGQSISRLLGGGEGFTTAEIMDRLNLPQTVTTETGLRAALRDAGATIQREKSGLHRRVWRLSQAAPAASRSPRSQTQTLNACHPQDLAPVEGIE